MSDRHRSRSRSPRRVSERTDNGIQERLKKLSGMENGSITDKEPRKKETVEDVLKIDREKTCPLLLRVFCNIGGHHKVEDFSSGKTPSNELQIYTWKDATLKELMNLVKEVNPEARRDGTYFDFAIVYPNFSRGGYNLKDIGTTCSGQSCPDDNATLHSKKFRIGNSKFIFYCLNKENNKKMGLSGGKACVKYLMFIFNFLFLIMGAILLGVGIWLKVDKSISKDVTDQFFTKYSFLTSSNIAIGVGVFIIVISFLGCCGSVKEIRSLLCAFFVLMFLVFVAEIVAGAFAYTRRNDLQSDMQNDFKKAILYDYGTPNNGIINKTIDTFQETFSCCGYDKYTDYNSSVYTEKTHDLPKSCCIKNSGVECPTHNPDLLDRAYYQEGCFPKIMEFIKGHLILIGGLTIAFAIIQILGMVFSLVLFCAIGGKGEYV